MQVIVGRIGRAHGIKGEVGVEIRTDEPDRRFAVGGQVVTDSAPSRTLTVSAVRWHGERLLVRFDGIADRTGAETLRNLVVLAEIDSDERPEDPDEFYDRDLVGLRVRTAEDGEAAGTVTAVVHGSSQDLLEIVRPDGRKVLVPLVAELVPTVDLEAGHVVVADRPGLLDPDSADNAAADAADNAALDTAAGEAGGEPGAG